jgi:hypothetical protein
MDKGTSEVAAREVARIDSTRDNALLDSLRTHFNSGELDFILTYLDDSKLRVIHEESWTEPEDYLINAWIESMSEAELEGYHYYNALPEFTHHYFEHKRNFLGRERNFVRWNLGISLGRCPSEDEVEIAFTDEILQKGKSISAKCRAFYAMKYADRVEYVSNDRPVIPFGGLEEVTNSGQVVAA